MNIAEMENRLFAEWQKKYESFVVDGAPHPDAFLASPRKTLIVLKDVNVPGHKGIFDLREQMATEPHEWWRTIAAWCAGILRLDENLSWSEIKEIPIDQCLKSFAFMQLKKSAGIGSVSKEMMRKHASRDAAEIRVQIGIYRPHLIVCAGVGEILGGILGASGWRETRKGVRYTTLDLDSGQTYLIDYMHPSVRAAKNIICYGLLDACREIFGQYHGINGVPIR